MIKSKKDEGKHVARVGDIRKTNTVWRCKPESCGSGQGAVARSYMHGNEYSCSINDGQLLWLASNFSFSGFLLHEVNRISHANIYFYSCTRKKQQCIWSMPQEETTPNTAILRNVRTCTMRLASNCTSFRVSFWLRTTLLEIKKNLSRTCSCRLDNQAMSVIYLPGSLIGLLSG
jgi:hypothetical protein